MLDCSRRRGTPLGVVAGATSKGGGDRRSRGMRCCCFGVGTEGDRSDFGRSVLGCINAESWNMLAYAQLFCIFQDLKDLQEMLRFVPSAFDLFLVDPLFETSQLLVYLQHHILMRSWQRLGLLLRVSHRLN